MSSVGRVLGRLRLSVASDESTSIERQREVITGWAEANGHQVVGWAEDVDVSGSIDPFDTPQLGDWLGNRAPEFDVIACWKLDRLSRNSIKLNKLFGWCLDHDKTVVSCSESIDLSTPVGRLIANVIGFLAEGELEAIRERQRSSRQKLRELARWPGGKPPYGYHAVKRAGGGYVLEVDKPAAEVVRRIVSAVIDGTGVGRIAADLNRDGVHSPAQRYDVLRGREPRDGIWQAGPIKIMLRSPSLRGQAHHKGSVVRDDTGQPVQLAPPLVTDDEWMLVQAELDRVQGAPRQRLEPAPLAGIALCWFCAKRLSSTTQVKRGKEYRYYRCQNSCTPLIPAGTAEQRTDDELLSTLGDEQVTERVWVPGDSNEAALREAVTAFDALSAAAGAMASQTAKDRLQRQLAALDAHIVELENRPAREGRYDDRPTGETYREALERTAADPDARRALLERVGLSIRMGIHDGHLLLHPERLGDRLPMPQSP